MYVRPKLNSLFSLHVLRHLFIGSHRIARFKELRSIAIIGVAYIKEVQTQHTHTCSEPDTQHLGVLFVWFIENFDFAKDREVGFCLC